MPQFNEQGYWIVKDNEEMTELDAQISIAQEKKGQPLTQGEIDKLRFQYDPRIQRAETPERTLGERFQDSYEYSRSPGGEGENALLGRQISDAFDADLRFQQTAQKREGTPEELEAERDSQQLAEARNQREVFSRRQLADPAWKEDQSFFSNILRSGADIAGDTTGNINPSYLLGAGKTILGRALSQAGINAGIDLGVQGGEISEGLQDEYDPWRTAVQGGVGFGLSAGGDVIARSIRSEFDLGKQVDVPVQDRITEAYNKGLTYEQIVDEFPDEFRTDEAQKQLREWVLYRNQGGEAELELNIPTEEVVQEEDVVTRLTNELNAASRLNREQREIYRTERKKRLEKVRDRAQATDGQEGFIAERAALGGQFDKVEFEGIGDKFTQQEIDSVFNMIKTSDQFTNNPFGSITARTGLLKLLEGEVPTRSELNQISKVFPEDFVEAALSQQNTSRRVGDTLANVLNVPRALMSSLDLSAPLRQGLFLVGRKEWWTAAASMMRQVGSERAFEAVKVDIESRPSFQLMEEANLSLTERGGLDLTAREEDFQTDLARRIPILGKGVDASERAYLGFLNKLRADTFDRMINDLRKAGFEPEENSEMVKEVAQYINNATGRGDLKQLPGGKTLEESSPILNATFFSPRLMASRINLLRPDYYARMSPVVRQNALRDLVTLGAVGTTALTLAYEMGFDVEIDPRSSDFGKVRDGTTRYDIFGGFGQYITLGARLATGETKTIAGDKKNLGENTGPMSQDHLDVTTRFLRSKLSPLASFVVDGLDGENVVGEEFTLPGSAIERVTPFFVGDLITVLNEEGIEGVPKVAPSVFGIGYSDFDQVPTERPFNNKEDVWVKEIEALDAIPSSNYTSNFKINGVEVNPTDEEMQAYQEVADSLIYERFQNLLRDPDFTTLEREEKQELMDQMAIETRAEVRQNLFRGFDNARRTN